MSDILADPLTLLSDRLARLVDEAARSIVAVHSGRRSSTSAIHWRPGVLVTAEEALERDDNISVTLPDGRTVAATLAGRDPTTDVAALRFQPDGLPTASLGDSTTLRAGHIVLAVGRQDDGPATNQGVVSFAGGPWQSLRGGTIDRLLRLDLRLSPRVEGGALVDVHGRTAGMTVRGARGRTLAIPTSTIDRVIDQLLVKGHIARGYLGAGLQRARLRQARGVQGQTEAERGVLVVSIDPNGPAARAGLLVGDAITAWNGAAVTRVREVMGQLGTDSVGTSAELRLLRGGMPTTLNIAIGERPHT
ncbi:MAG TPA: trypsin-like peptidase domain-containing protein [Stellaceae bacterium]|nr:trypsin-like peptidase domain-containing protein [Stellaceae bacterium]